MTPAAPSPASLPPRPDLRAGGRRLGRLVLSLGVVLALVWGARVAVVTSRAVETAEDAQDVLLTAYADRFEEVTLLTGGEESALRRSLNARHVSLARDLGVPPPATRDERDRVAATLVALDSLPAFVVRRARYSAAAVTPDAAASLDSIAVAFTALTRAAGLPDARPTLTSVFRSAEDQAALQQVNANAAAGTSSHEYATTYDLAYRRFKAVPPPAPGVAWHRVTPAWLRAPAEAALAERWRDAVARVAAAYPARYDALLGRALIALEDRGVLVVVRERQQPVYHVTVARRLAGD